MTSGAIALLACRIPHPPCVRAVLDSQSTENPDLVDGEADLHGVDPAMELAVVILPPHDTAAPLVGIAVGLAAVWAVIRKAASSWRRMPDSALSRVRDIAQRIG